MTESTAPGEEIKFWQNYEQSELNMTKLEPQNKQ